MSKPTTRAEALRWLRQFSPAQVKRLIKLMEAMASTEGEVQKP